MLTRPAQSQSISMTMDALGDRETESETERDGTGEDHMATER